MDRAPAEPDLAERIEARLAPAATVLGVIFVLVVIGEGLATPGSWTQRAFLVAGWALWLFFVGEFLVRFAVAPSKGRFLRRSWWQVVFLFLPFLRFVSWVRVARLTRAGRIAGSAVRGARSAGSVLRSRLGWVASIHAIVVLAASQALFEFGDQRSYGSALYRVALASVSGEPIASDVGWVRVLDVGLATYAIVVFASLAAALGSFLLERRRDDVRAGR